MQETKTPWLTNYGEVPFHLEYHPGTMFQMVEDAARANPGFIAYDFMGGKASYQKFVSQVHECAKALSAIGIKENDTVTVCMPNCPQTLIIFYAIHLVGAVASMIHPLSSENEIAFYVKEADSRVAVTLDQFYYKFEAIADKIELDTLILASIKDYLPQPLKTGYLLTEGRKIRKVEKNAPVLWWKELLKKAKEAGEGWRIDKKPEELAVILFSGGTTGVSKGIMLSHRNFNALAAQIVATNPMFRPGDRMLAAMPMFHGFGLGVSVHSMLANGGRCVLVPRFTPESYAKLLLKHRCNFIAGVPTLFEALLRQKVMEGEDLSCLKGVFSGGDSLSVELKKRLDKFLTEHNCSVLVREGYGTTECVTASCLTPLHLAKEGSIGQPFPDTYYKIVRPGTVEEVPYGEDGEICLSGPSVMMGYLKHPEETADTLKVHDDGRTWVHTGDLGRMDEEGFVYFRQRIKRMIITSGYNVYPSQLENIIDGHEKVLLSCVIGIRDDYRGQKIKAYVVPMPGVAPSEDLKTELLDYCSGHIARYAMPREIEFRKELPKTLVGKVAYRVLEEEANAALAN